MTLPCLAFVQGVPSEKLLIMFTFVLSNRLLHTYKAALIPTKAKERNGMTHTHHPLQIG